jgi:ParB family chromosome partitioning protein
MQDRFVFEVPVTDVAPSPRNPRHHLEGLDELAESIRAHGLLQPMVERRVENRYELVAGHRRLAAVQQLSWAKVPAVDDRSITGSRRRA